MIRLKSRASGRTCEIWYSRTIAGAIVDRVDHVVERARQGVDVFAVEGGDEGLVQALDDFVGQEVALVLDFLDLVGLVPERLVGGEHLHEQACAAVDLLGHRDEIFEELLFLRDQSERQHPLRAGILADSAQI